MSGESSLKRLAWRYACARRGSPEERAFELALRDRILSGLPSDEPPSEGDPRFADADLVDPRYAGQADLWRAIRAAFSPRGPREVSRVMNALIGGRILTPEDLRRRSYDDLRGVRNLGKKSIDVLIDAGLAEAERDALEISLSIVDDARERSRILRALVDAGIRTPDDLARLTPDDALGIRGIGRWSAHALRGLLRELFPSGDLDRPHGLIRLPAGEAAFGRVIRRGWIRDHVIRRSSPALIVDLDDGHRVAIFDDDMEDPDIGLRSLVGGRVRVERVDEDGVPRYRLSSADEA